MPVLEDFPVAAVPRSPYPNDSDLYNAIRCAAAAALALSFSPSSHYKMVLKYALGYIGDSNLTQVLGNWY